MKFAAAILALCGVMLTTYQSTQSNLTGRIQHLENHLDKTTKDKRELSVQVVDLNDQLRTITHRVFLLETYIESLPCFDPSTYPEWLLTYLATEEEEKHDI